MDVKYCTMCFTIGTLENPIPKCDCNHPILENVNPFYFTQSEVEAHLKNAFHNARSDLRRKLLRLQIDMRMISTKGEPFYNLYIDEYNKYIKDELETMIGML